MTDPLADQERAAVREAGIAVGMYYAVLRACNVPWWMACRLVLAYATGEDRSAPTVEVTYSDDEG